jgi:uncharacterized protein
MKYAPTARTTVKRLKKRGHYEAATVHAILDEGFICHVGFTVQEQPFVIPTIYARDGEQLYFHGAFASRMLRVVGEGIPVCLTVTLLDGIVLARSAFHHSLNYRSVVALGKARLVDDPDERMRALQVITDHVAPQRWDEVRAPSKLELKQTTVLALHLGEVSAKVRSGPPVDDEEDYALPVWAGVLPLTLSAGAPLADARLHTDAAPLNTARFARSKAKAPT